MQLKAVNLRLVLGRVLCLAALGVDGVQHVGERRSKVHAVGVLVARGLRWAGQKKASGRLSVRRGQSGAAAVGLTPAPVPALPRRGACARTNLGDVNVVAARAKQLDGGLAGNVRQANGKHLSRWALGRAVSGCMCARRVPHHMRKPAPDAPVSCRTGREGRCQSRRSAGRGAGGDAGENGGEAVLSQRCCAVPRSAARIGLYRRRTFSLSSIFCRPRFVRT